MTSRALVLKVGTVMAGLALVLWIVYSRFDSVDRFRKLQTVVVEGESSLVDEAFELALSHIVVELRDDTTDQKAVFIALGCDSEQRYIEPKETFLVELRKSLPERRLQSVRDCFVNSNGGYQNATGRIGALIVCEPKQLGPSTVSIDFAKACGPACGYSSSGIVYEKKGGSWVIVDAGTTGIH